MQPFKTNSSYGNWCVYCRIIVDGVDRGAEPRFFWKKKDALAFIAANADILDV